MKDTWQPANFDDFKMPETLYKYREWNKDTHKTILTERIVYLSRPTQFLDVNDCKIPDRYDLLTDEELYERILRRSPEINPTYSQAQHQAFAKIMTNRSPAKNPIESARIQEQLFQEFDNQVGVLSLTANPMLFRMWVEYSGNHSGFCVGFNGSSLFEDPENRFGMIGDVIYSEELPIIHPNEELLSKVRKRAFYKLEERSFEEEYRITKTMYKPADQDWRMVQVNSDKFREIIFGAKMADKDKQEIIQVVGANFANIKFRQAEIDEVNQTVQIIDLNI